VSSYLECYQQGEDEWDRDAIVRGFLDCRAFECWPPRVPKTERTRALVIRLERRGIRRYVCSGCGGRTGRVRSVHDRTWHDVPWASHPVTLVYAQRRVRCRRCRRCGIRTERMEFADPKARVTRRLRQQIGVDCQSMPTSHAAVRHGVSWSKARRAELAFLAEWDRTRPRKRPRHIGLDEIQRGKRATLLDRRCVAPSGVVGHRPPPPTPHLAVVIASYWTSTWRRSIACCRNGSTSR
jgi:hypothetical protein